MWARVVSAALLLLIAGAMAAACAGGGGETTSTVIRQWELTPEIVTSDLAVGPNSFALGLITKENELLLDARAHARFFKLEDDKQVLRGEGDLAPVNITLTYTETHADGTVHTHEAGETGVYKANVEFDEPGMWAVEVAVTAEGKTYEPVAVQFEVREKSLTPAVGQPAPRSRQTILSDVAGNIAEIDTSDPPDPKMHEMTITEAVTSGRPALIVFATPAFCVSRVCGPTKQIVDQLYPRYNDKVNFIHVEPYDLKRARSGEGLFPLPVVEEWGLPTEPWIFIVDSKGIIAAKFEGIVAQSELEQALQDVLR